MLDSRARKSLHRRHGKNATRNEGVGDDTVTTIGKYVRTCWEVLWEEIEVLGPARLPTFKQRKQKLLLYEPADVEGEITISRGTDALVV